MNNIFQKTYLDILNNNIFLKIKNSTFKLKVSKTKPEIIKGLMNVNHLAENEGMIFLFNDFIVHNFWMKNTIIPLDVIFLNNKNRVICWYSMDIENPKNEFETLKQYENRLKKYSSKIPCKAAIELNYGICNKLKLKNNDFINLDIF